MPAPVIPLPDRFWAKVDRRGPEDCWPWRGCVNAVSDYGEFRLDGVVMTAHRAAYLLLVGPIPEGQEVDHLCRNRPCVNPSHLEAVTNRENGRRGRVARLDAVRPCGHPRAVADDFISGDCPECARARAVQRRRSIRDGSVTLRIVSCADCGENQPLCARGLCRKCYTRYYRAKHREPARAASA